MMKFNLKVSLYLLLLLPSLSNAATPTPTPAPACVGGVYTNGVLKGMKCDGPITTTTQVLDLIRNVLTNFLLPPLGALFLIMFAIGGIQYITSAGDPSRAEKGKKTLTWAVLGLLLVISAEVIIGLFSGMLGGGVR